MFALPEWAPSVHPLIVHFPIALLFIAVLADLLSLVFRQHAWLRWAASGLFTLGALSAVVTLFTGQEAAESVFLSASANSLLTDHANWAEWTVWFYGLYAVARGVVEWRQIGHLRAVSIPLFIIGAAGLLLVKETGEHGAQMVYAYGVGVKNTQGLQTSDWQNKVEGMDHGDGDQVHTDEEEGEHHHDGLDAEDYDHAEGKGDNHEAGETHEDSAEGTQESAHTSDDGGQMFQTSSTEINFTQNGWKWDVGKDGAQEFRKQFMMVLGDWGDVQVAVDNDNTEEEVLTLQTHDVPMMFTSGLLISNLQYDLRLKRTEFSGAVRLVHHVQDAENYNFLEIRGTKIVLGRVVNGILDIEDRGEITADGWLDVRVVSDGSHFRGYVNKKMVVHGHGTEPDAGLVGFYIRGTGVVMFDKLDVQVLK